MKKINILFILFILFIVVTSCRHLPVAPKAKDIFPDLPRIDMDNFYVFGDSLSDTGNLFLIIDGMFDNFFDIRLQAPPASKPGRKFSNGFLIAEYLAAHYKMPFTTAWKPSPSKNPIADENREAGQTVLELLDISNDNATMGSNVPTVLKNFSYSPTTSQGNNYAFGGATIYNFTDTLKIRFLSEFRLEKQVALHQSVDKSKRSSDKTLHMIMIGGNDIKLIVNHKNPESKIDSIVAAYIKQINELQTMGAKKIIVSTAPDIGKIPLYSTSSSSKLATELSKSLEEKMIEKINTSFDSSRVHFISVINIFNNVITQWPKEQQDKACVSDFVDSGINWADFLKHSGELKIRYVNGCNENSLAEGKFPFFDKIHGTDAIYKKATRYYIRAINKFMK